MSITLTSKSKCNKQPCFSWSLIYEKHRRFAPRPRRVAPKSDTSNTQKKEPPFCGLPKINYLCIVMYKQLTSEQRSQFFALLQRKSLRKEIARIVGISQSTLSRELKRNGSPSGKYVWFKAHDKAMEVVSLKVCNSSFFSLYFHCFFILFFPTFELVYSPAICRLCFLHCHRCQ